MKKHVELLGILYIVFNVLNLFIGLLVLIILAGIGVVFPGLDLSHQYIHNYSLMVVLSTVGLFVMIILTITSIPGIIGGYALLKKLSWARALGIILGCFNLFNVPFGTLLGIYTLWVLLQDEAISHFGDVKSMNDTKK